MSSLHGFFCYIPQGDCVAYRTSDHRVGTEPCYGTSPRAVIARLVNTFDLDCHDVRRSSLPLWDKPA